MGRRRFDHLVLELSVALGLAVPRYELWLFLHDRGLDPERLRRADMVRFCDQHLEDLLADHGWRLEPRARRRMTRSLRRFDPRHPSAYERMERLGTPES